MMDFQWIGIFIVFIIFLVLWAVWIKKYGLMRGFLAGACRGIWLSPFIFVFFPQTKSERIPESLSLRPLHILKDDSFSMDLNMSNSGNSFSETSSRIVKEVSRYCASVGCLPKITNLSDLSPRVKDGFTPLSDVLESWIYSANGEPWLLISDGGDFQPASEWRSSLRHMGIGGEQEVRGFIYTLESPVDQNYWIEIDSGPLFSFEEKPVRLQVTLNRNGNNLQKETVQVHVSTEDQSLTSVNATLEEGESSVNLFITSPPLSRGYHLLSIKALPTAAEKTVWDNTIFKNVEVLPNTVGILHLLGSPSWSGRFLRRHLKAEPKYDLISFFILRDPGDMQLVNERELSLIPFPVDRLFNEELPNFHVVIIQNFALYQFLEPEYQKNLIKFVKNGGGLLFIGGPRALQSGDLHASDLSSILPFSLQKNKMGITSPFLRGVDKSGPYYDPKVNFSIEMANPTSNQRALADVYDDWLALGDSLQQFRDLQGIHHMENVRFKDGSFTPLINAIDSSGKKFPLAVASYPEKGRALWIFSDTLWKTALSPSSLGSRETYNQFMGSALTWLLRQEIKKPLIISNLSVVRAEKQKVFWRFDLMGPAARHFSSEKSWQISICGQLRSRQDFTLEKMSSDRWRFSGFLNMTLAGGMRCSANISGAHPAFGSVEAKATSVIAKIYRDEEILGSTQKMSELAGITGARLSINESLEMVKLYKWLKEITGFNGIAKPSKFKSYRNFYWLLNSAWFYLILLFIPLEVVVRRWPQIARGQQVSVF